MRTVGALFLGLLVTACVSSGGVPTVTFPASNDVATLRPEQNDRGAVLQVITDPHRVAGFLEALRPLTEKRWRDVQFGTPPIEQARVELIGRNGTSLCRVDIGTNWLGSTCGGYKGAEPPKVALTSSQARYFRDYVGGTWEIR
jgi:hypothetical protein